MQQWRLLLTRTAPDCQLQVDQLNARGYFALALPLIETQPLPETSEQRGLLLDFDRYNTIIVISKTAAKLMLERLDYYWPQLPVQQTWFTVGQATAEILTAAGLAAYYPLIGDNSEALWKFAKFQQQLATPNCRILITKGQGGRTWLTEQLQLAGIASDTIDLYKRHSTIYSEQTIWQTIQNNQINAIVISSAQSLHNLATLMPQHWQQLTQLTFWVPSERLVKQAQLLGIKQIVNCQNASLNALIERLNSHPSL